MPSVLITGANRGIGLEFARQYAADGWQVIATCRRPDAAAELAKLPVEIHPLDVTDFDAVAALAQKLTGRGIDILLNNAAHVGTTQNFGMVDTDEWAQVMALNVMAPLKMAEAFISHVARSRRKLIACMSSKMGSIANNTTGGNYIYRSSKAALNAVVKSLSVDLAPRGIAAVALHPGWVKTEMGGPDAVLTADASASRLRRVLDGVTLAQTGRFIGFDGSEVSW